MRRVGDSDTELRDRLDSLKRNGSALLVVGDVPDDSYAHVSRRMLGDTTYAPRKRALVVGGHARPFLADRLPETPAVGGEATHVITHGTTARSVVETAGGVTPMNPTSRVDADDLDSLGNAVLDVIDDLDGDDLDPAELRFAFDTLQTLIDTSDDFDVFALVDLLAHRVRQANGIAHFRLPRDRDDYHVHLLQPVFDAVIELRVNGDDVEQRWEFPDDGSTTEWMTIED